MTGKQYSQDEVLLLGKRVNNPKRSYLLVNPLQAKHVPVSPIAALEMMRSLGTLVRQSCPGKCLVIGFAETATAVAAAVSLELDKNCRYIQTTRECVEGVRQWLFFSEEHSHATEQKLCGDSLPDWIGSADHIVIVDDEFSTGRTLINIAKAMKAFSPAAETRDYIAASIVNRVDEEHEKLLRDEGFRCVYLVKPRNEDYEDAVSSLAVEEAEPCSGCADSDKEIASLQLQTPYLNPRKGVLSREYVECCKAISYEVLQILQPMLTGTGLVVIGTEECMFPALIVGKLLEQSYKGLSVSCHATTRSPIGISKRKDYPIQNGYRIRSLYDPERTTFLYNLREYDTAIIVTDAPEEDREEGLRDIQTVLQQFGCDRLICFGIGE